MKKIAVMQPYLFPYAGYFQLIRAVDKFILFDDVNFIMRGWINRNNILMGGQKSLFSIPLVKASQNKLINETAISDTGKWKEKFLRTITMAYAKAPYFKEIYSLIESITYQEDVILSKFIYKSLVKICETLGITTTIVPSSSVFNNRELKGQTRILDICIRENAGIYINAIGGRELYDRELFESKGIDLRFIQSGLMRYNQFKEPFVPGLSIIDVMMFNPRERIETFLDDFQLV